MNNDILNQGIQKLDIVLSDEIKAKLEQYIQLLLKWNKTYSLTAIKKYEDMVIYHILDGITLVKYLLTKDNIHDLIDVGSGMGVPGVILAICLPHVNVVLLDSNQKKTIFLQQVVIELKLDNLTVVTKRIEDYIVRDKFDIAISRAFADSFTFIQLSKHLVKVNGKFLAMKSRLVDQELDSLFNYTYRKIPVKIPDVSDERVLLEIDNR